MWQHLQYKPKHVNKFQNHICMITFSAQMNSLSIYFILNMAVNCPVHSTVFTCENWKLNEYLLMGCSDNHILLTFQWFMTFTPPNQQTFIELSIFADFFLPDVNDVYFFNKLCPPLKLSFSLYFYPDERSVTGVGFVLYFLYNLPFKVSAVRHTVCLYSDWKLNIRAAFDLMDV